MGAMTRSVHSSTYGALKKKLLVLREEAGLSQRGLAARLGVPHSWVAKVESGERRLDVVEFIEFAQACGVNPSKAFDELTVNLPLPPKGRARKGAR